MTLCRYGTAGRWFPSFNFCWLNRSLRTSWPSVQLDSFFRFTVHKCCLVSRGFWVYYRDWVSLLPYSWTSICGLQKPTFWFLMLSVSWSGNGLVGPIGRGISLGDEKENVKEMKEVDIHRTVTVEWIGNIYSSRMRIYNIVKESVCEKSLLSLNKRSRDQFCISEQTLVY